MNGATAGIVTVVLFCLKLSAGLSRFKLLENECGSLALNDEFGAKIINGANARFGAHPWMAFVHTPTHFICAGSLINHRFVLTAAHCIKDDGSQLLVRLGEYDRDKEVDCLGNLCMDPSQEFEVIMAFRHAFFKSSDQTNDIGLLLLEKRVEYTPQIQPICVFVDSSMKPLVDRLTWFNATGWGRTDLVSNTARVLQEVRLNRRPVEDCQRMFAIRMQPTQICSGNVNSNLCQGDSGGPQGREMAYGNRRVYVQLGIASFTNLRCLNVSILTDVLSHGNWIKRVVQRFGVREDAELEDSTESEPLTRYPTFYQPI